MVVDVRLAGKTRVYLRWKQRIYLLEKYLHFEKISLCSYL